jgi:DNA-binding IscR family transcriptional regulator
MTPSRPQSTLLQTFNVGVLTATTGPRGGFRLAQPPAEITRLQIVEAVDGTSRFYQCNELRQRGRGAAAPEQCRKICGIAAHMQAAETAWRASLRRTERSRSDCRPAEASNAA